MGCIPPRSRPFMFSSLSIRGVFFLADRSLPSLGTEMSDKPPLLTPAPSSHRDQDIKAHRSRLSSMRAVIRAEKKDISVHAAPAELYDAKRAFYFPQIDPLCDLDGRETSMAARLGGKSHTSPTLPFPPHAISKCVSCITALASLRLNELPTNYSHSDVVSICHLPISHH